MAASGLEVDVVDTDAVVRDDAKLRPGRVEEGVVDAAVSMATTPSALRRVDELEIAGDRLLDLPGNRLDEMDTRPHG